MSIARVLVIAGSDSGGGAGIQADIKTITMLGGHAMTAITAITAQNTLGVQAVHAVPTDMVLAQIASVVEDIGVDAVKIGMIGSATTADAVADVLDGLDVPVVFDPVMVATSGSVLADASTIAAFERLMRLASVVTPNLPELVALASVRAELVEAPPFPFIPPEEESRASTSSARTGEGVREQMARGLAARFDADVLAKGGHDDGDPITDFLVGAQTLTRFTNPRMDTLHTHGTGCTLASGVAVGLAQGLDLEAAVARAIRFVRAALAAAPGLGHGRGPMGHALGGTPFDQCQA